MSGNEQPAELSTKQERAIEALLLHPTIAQAARAAGIGESTLRRWMQDDAFRRSHRQATKQRTEQALLRVQSAMAAAVSALEAVMNDGTAPASARVSAARVLLDVGIRAFELDDIDGRLSALEARLIDGQGSPGRPWPPNVGNFTRPGE